MDMAEIFGLNLGECGGTLSVKFQRTVNTRQYESEVTNVTASVEIKQPIDGTMRVAIQSLLLAQAEYTVLLSLYYKKQVNGYEFSERLNQLTTDVNAMLGEVERTTGRPAKEVLKDLGVEVTIPDGKEVQPGQGQTQGQGQVPTNVMPEQAPAGVDFNLPVAGQVQPAQGQVQQAQAQPVQQGPVQQIPTQQIPVQQTPVQQIPGFVPQPAAGFSQVPAQSYEQAQRTAGQPVETIGGWTDVKR